jgi:type I restriction enzyme S subunit
MNKERLKQTKFGLLPYEWSLAKISDLLQKGIIVSHLDGNHGGEYPRSEEFVREGVPYISANSILSGNVDFSKAKYLSLDRANRIRKGIAKSGDVLFAHNATVGPVAVLITDEPRVILSTTLTYFRCDEKSLHNYYLKAFFETDLFVRQYSRIMAQSTRNQVPITTQRRFYIVLPPFSEQFKIAKILFAWDEAIAKTERLIVALHQRKKSIMQRLLTGQLRFPKFDHEWEEMELGQFLKPTIRKVEKPKDGYLRLGLRSHGKGTFTSTMDTDDSEAVAMSHLFEVREGDLIVSITFAWEGAIAIVGKDGDGALVSHRFPTYIFDTKKVLPEFFRYVMLTKRFFYDLRLISPGGAGRNRVMSKTDFLKLKVKVPSIEEQKKIGGTLVAIDEYIKALTKKLELFQQQKKGLMQKLLTGQIRVKV